MKVEILKQKGHNFLWVDDYLWMWDIPVECRAQKEIADKAYGKVLIVGYGLGIIQRLLLQNNRVDSIVTIEIYSEVVEANKKAFGKIYGDVFYCDFYKYNTISKFDCVIGDIWEDIIPECLEKYEKFENKANQLLKEGGKILAWGKEFFEYLIDKRFNV